MVGTGVIDLQNRDIPQRPVPSRYVWNDQGVLGEAGDQLKTIKFGDVEKSYVAQVEWREDIHRHSDHAVGPSA